jgi:prepilin-type processing-associated H-X9-DG protein
MYRSKAVEANCSSNITFVDGNVSTKACVPP